MNGERLKVALVHDYLTQKGGAERVALELTRVFPGAPLYTTFYDPDVTFPEFREVDIRTTPWLNGRKSPSSRFRTMFPFFPLAIRALGVIDADVVVCSSSGWSHAVRTTGKKIVYCHNPARWLYQPAAYFGGLHPWLRPLAAFALSPWRVWDQAAARSADRYLANSANVAARIGRVYRRQAQVLHPPRGLNPEGPKTPVLGVEPGFYLTVSRKRGYKRSAEIAEAFAEGPRRLVQVGGGDSTSPNVTRLVDLSDPQMRWLYSNAAAVIAIGDEDFGLTPVECYAAGTPALVLASGGYLETSDPAVSILIKSPTASAVRVGLDEFESTSFDTEAIRAHAQKWSPEAFQRAIQDQVWGVNACSRYDD